MMNLMFKRTGIFGSVTARPVAVLCTLAMVALSLQGCGVHRHQQRQVKYLDPSECKFCVHSKTTEEGDLLTRTEKKTTGPYASSVSVVGDDAIVNIVVGQQCRAVDFRNDTVESRQTVRKQPATGLIGLGLGTLALSTLVGAGIEGWGAEDNPNPVFSALLVTGTISGLVAIFYGLARDVEVHGRVEHVGWYNRQIEEVVVQAKPWNACDVAIPLNYTVALTAADGVTTALYRLATPDKGMRLPGYYLPAAFWQNPKWTLTVSQDANTPGGSSTPRPVQITVAGDLSAPAASRTAWEKEQQRAAQKKQDEKDAEEEAYRQYKVAIEDEVINLQSQKNVCRNLYVGQAVLLPHDGEGHLTATIIGIASTLASVRLDEYYQNQEVDCLCIYRPNDTDTALKARTSMCH